MASDLRYRDLEGAAAGVLEVPERELGAFRAKIRHLRNIGVPNVPARGSGTQTTYSREHVFSVITALELGRLGQSPKFVKDAAFFLEDQWRKIELARKDQFLSIAAGDRRVPRNKGEGRPQMMSIIKKDELDWVLDGSSTVCLVNLSEIIRKADAALK